MLLFNFLLIYQLKVFNDSPEKKRNFNIVTCTEKFAKVYEGQGFKKNYTYPVIYANVLNLSIFLNVQCFILFV